jgi:suppressor for copper-sensitivity B
MMLARFSAVVILSAAFSLLSRVEAEAAATGWTGDGHVAVRLITATDTIGASSTLDAGLEFRFAEGWHGYWRTPGDAGVAPMIDWSGSENISREEVAWPAPSRLVSEDLQTLIYKNDVVLPLKLSLKQAGAPARIHVSVVHGGCSEVCVPYQADLSLALPPGAGVPSAEAALIEAARKTVPGSPAAAGIDVVAARITGSGSDAMLAVDLRSSAGPFVRPDLFIEGIGDGIPAAPEVAFRNGGHSALLIVRLPALPPANRPLTLTLMDQDRSAEFQIKAR